MTSWRAPWMIPSIVLRIFFLIQWIVVRKEGWIRTCWKGGPCLQEQNYGIACLCWRTLSVALVQLWFIKLLSFLQDFGHASSKIFSRLFLKSCAWVCEKVAYVNAAHIPKRMEYRRCLPVVIHCWQIPHWSIICPSHHGVVPQKHGACP